MDQTEECIKDLEGIKKPYQTRSGRITNYSIQLQDCSDVSEEEDMDDDFVDPEYIPTYEDQDSDEDDESVASNRRTTSNAVLTINTTKENGSGDHGLRRVHGGDHYVSESKPIYSLGNFGPHSCVSLAYYPAQYYSRVQKLLYSTAVQKLSNLVQIEQVPPAHEVTCDSSSLRSHLQTDDNGNERKERKVRTVFTEDHLSVLEAMFSEGNYYPTQDQRELVGIKLGLSVDTITNWFNNKRAKWRKESRQKFH